MVLNEAEWSRETGAKEIQEKFIIYYSQPGVSLTPFLADAVVKLRVLSRI